MATTDDIRRRMIAALLSPPRSQSPLASELANALQKPAPPVQNWLNRPLPMEGRFNLLPIIESQPGGGPSLFNKRSLALPGVLASAVNAFTAPGRAMDAQPGYNPEEEGVNLALNMMGGGLGASRFAPAPRGSVGMNAFHGSPYKFDAFDMGKIGTGEGAQAYGHGLYFAENPRVAREYQTQVKDMAMIDAANKRMSELARVMERDQIQGSYRQYRTETGRAAAREYDELMDKKMAPGHMYHVDVPDEAIGKMLDWNKPLSQQSRAIQDLARQVGVGAAKGPTKAKLAAFISGTENAERGIVATGEDLYRALADYGGNSVEGSKALAAAGIPGIRYLDQASRSGGNGTRNFVLFDDKLARITKRE